MKSEDLAKAQWDSYLQEVAQVGTRIKGVETELAESNARLNALFAE